MDDDETDEVIDGRPAWLRRWPSEVRPASATGRHSAVGEPTPGFDEPQQRARGAAPAASKASDTTLSGSFPNGYAGQSIEAAFTFDTLYRFETEFEAEATEDWLHLSRNRVNGFCESEDESEETMDFAADVAEVAETERHGQNAGLHGTGEHADETPLDRSLHEFDLCHEAMDAPVREAELESPPQVTAELAATRKEQARRSEPDGELVWGASRAPGLEFAVDPQAVRAAIFRLAQESTEGFSTGRASENATARPGFSEVALGVWSGSGEGRHGVAEGRIHDVIQNVAQDGTQDETQDETQDWTQDKTQRVTEVETKVEIIGTGELKDVHVSFLNPKGGRATDRWPWPDNHMPQTDDAKTNENCVPVRATLEPAAAADAYRADREKADREKVDPPQADGNFALAGGPSDASTELPAACLPTKDDAVLCDGTASVLPVTGGSVALAREEATSAPSHPGSEEVQESACGMDEGRPPFGEARGADPGAPVRDVAFMADTSKPVGVRPDHREPGGTAGSTPALAHDAGNLLSALNLYSELLALSGVLHARHKHYAQDLKLLAARSEVLIGRLLALSSVTESQAQSAVQERAPSGSAPICPGGPADTTGLDASAAREVVGLVEPAGGDTAALRTGPQTGLAAADCLPAQGEAIENPVRHESHKCGPESINTSFPVPSPDPASLPVLIKDETRHDLPEVPPLNLVDLLTRWRSLLSMIGRGSVEVNFGPNSALPIRVKEEAMERILVNVVHNAMTATRGGGAIRIGVGRVEWCRANQVTPSFTPSSDGRVRPDNRMVLTVDDSGCGMTEEQIARIFDDSPAGNLPRDLPRDLPSDRASICASNLGDGSDAADRPRRGMGLQIVRELLAASGGQLEIYSRRGAGTRIKMEWPTVEDAPNVQRIPPASAGVVGNDLGSVRLPRQGPGTEVHSVNPSRQAEDLIGSGVEGAVAC